MTPGINFPRKSPYDGTTTGSAEHIKFYEFCLEKHIPDEHLLRQIDQFLDFDQTRAYLDALL